ncbi:hypothetical protein [Thioalkalivibrio sp. HK1]|uniref:hypothetical protein n=1 Tax=Thioalkalivibrio sp. HK1 TaxID=1469245 RepID=UPI000471255E|nr:hypothetical protein [Thioalkalivibrio sp. HK1]
MRYGLANHRGIGGIVITLIVGFWRVITEIRAVDGRIDTVKDDLANLKAEVGYIKGRLDPCILCILAAHVNIHPNTTTHRAG